MRIFYIKIQTKTSTSPLLYFTSIQCTCLNVFKFFVHRLDRSQNFFLLALYTNLEYLQQLFLVIYQACCSCCRSSLYLFMVSTIFVLLKRVASQVSSLSKNNRMRMDSCEFSIRPNSSEKSRPGFLTFSKQRIFRCIQLCSMQLSHRLLEIKLELQSVVASLEEPDECEEADAGLGCCCTGAPPISITS